MREPEEAFRLWSLAILYHAVGRRAESDAAVKAVVLTGSDKAFCGGAEIREFNTEKSRVRPSLPALNLAG